MRTFRSGKFAGCGSGVGVVKRGEVLGEGFIHIEMARKRFQENRH